jgi:hypothetical protein
MVTHRRLLGIYAVLFVLPGCWKIAYDLQVPAPRPLVAVSAGGRRCFTVAIEGATDREAKILEAALHEACLSLRDPMLLQYLNQNKKHLAEPDLDTIGNEGGGFARFIEPANIGAVTVPAGDPNLYVLVTDAMSTPGMSTPGVSDICIRGMPAVRASAISRSARLTDFGNTKLAMAQLVNTLAHEMMHLHSKDHAQECVDLFNDSEDDATQCHLVSYAVGNAAGCSFLARYRDPLGANWETCMKDQADKTPGGQGAGSRDPLGCAEKR